MKILILKLFDAEIFSQSNCQHRKHVVGFHLLFVPGPRSLVAWWSKPIKMVILGSLHMY